MALQDAKFYISDLKMFVYYDELRLTHEQLVDLRSTQDVMTQNELKKDIPYGRTGSKT